MSSWSSTSCRHSMKQLLSLRSCCCHCISKHHDLLKIEVSILMSQCSEQHQNKISLPMYTSLPFAGDSFPTSKLMSRGSQKAQLVQAYDDPQCLTLCLGSIWHLLKRHMLSSVHHAGRWRASIAILCRSPLQRQTKMHSFLGSCSRDFSTIMRASCDGGKTQSRSIVLV